MALTDAAIDRIKALIVSGELRPGDKLPKEADLAGDLGLSRNSLREAIRALSLIRVLDVRQGDGTYVTSLEPEVLLDTLAFVLEFHRDDSVLQLMEVRRILEPAATAMAAQLMSDVDISALTGLLDEMETATDPELMIAADLEFHRRIALGSGNRVLASLVDSLSVPTKRARLWRRRTQAGVTRRTHEQHRAIHRALVARDVEAARSWAAVHVAEGEDWLRLALASAT